MKTVKADTNKKSKIVQLNSKPTADVKKTGRSPNNTLKVTSTDPPKQQTTHDMIAQRAWSIWMSKGCVTGQDETNWHQAELELRNTGNCKGSGFDTDKE